jgi:hypothetical protein
MGYCVTLGTSLTLLSSSGAGSNTPPMMTWPWSLYVAPFSRPLLHLSSGASRASVVACPRGHTPVGAVHAEVHFSARFEHLLLGELHRWSFSSDNTAQVQLKRGVCM